MAESKNKKEEPGDRRLDTWSEIADYLRRDVTTAMRWKRDRGLPVNHVPGNAKRQTVYAYTKEIDAWLKGSESKDSEPGVSAERRSAMTPKEFINGDSGSRAKNFAFGVSETERNQAGPESRQTHGEKHVEIAGGNSVAGGDRNGESVLKFSQAAPNKVGQRTPLRYALAVGSIAMAATLTYIIARPAADPRVLAFTQLTNDGRLKDGHLVTDGSSIYFPELTPSGWTIAKVPNSGGDAKSISTFFKYPEVQDFDRSRSEILVLDPSNVEVRPGLWALPISGNAPRRVGNIMADAAAWAPDGNAIVYSAGRELFFCNVDGSGSRRIASLPGVPRFIRGSPDGKLLRFSLSLPEKEASEIWEIEPDGSNLHPLLPGWHNSGSMEAGEWTPNGNHFLFESKSAVNTGNDLYAFPEERGFWRSRLSLPVQLTVGPMQIEDWAPSQHESKIFAIVSKDRKALLRYVAGTNHFVPYLPNVSASEVDYSGDGQWISYVEIESDTLWKRHADGGGAVQLTSPPMGVELPRWSPNGKWIAFMGFENPDDISRVYVIPAEGGARRVVLPNGIPQGAPTWSPHGKRLAFGDLPGAREGSPRLTSIHIVDLSSTTASTLRGSEGLWTARWSPDGLQMAALTADSKVLKVYDFRTEEWRAVASAGRISDLNWSHKGDVIYFEDILSPAGPAIYRVWLRNSKVEKVANLTANTPIRSTWLGLAPDDSPLISNDVGTSELYALDLNLP